MGGSLNLILLGNFHQLQFEPVANTPSSLYIYSRPRLDQKEKLTFVIRQAQFDMVVTLTEMYHRSWMEEDTIA
jgi:hypothetical protein